MRPSASSTSLPSVALVGLSGYGNAHLEQIIALAEAGRASLVAAVSVAPTAEANNLRRVQELGCRIYPSFDALLGDERRPPDLCCLPTPIHTHARFTLEALRAGSNVLVEKPLCATYADFLRIEEVALASNRFVAVGFQDMYSSSIRRLKADLCAGLLGPIHTISVLGLWPRDLAYFTRNAWAGRLRTGGEWVNDSLVNNAFAHFLNLALFLSGPAPRAIARAREVQAERYRCQPLETFDTVRAELATDEGTQIFLNLTHSCRGYQPVRLRIEGDLGKIEWIHHSGYTVRLRNGESCWIPIAHDDKVRRQMFETVVERVNNPAADIYTASMAGEHVRVVQAIHNAGVVHDVPADARLELTEPGASAPRAICLPGIDEWLTTAHNQACSLAAAGCPWARSPSRAPAWQLSSPPGRAPSPVLTAAVSK